MAREGVILRCTECKSENYVTKNDKRKDKIEHKKYCKKCNASTLHKQKK